MYKSEGFTSKDLAEAKRLLIISERDAGKFKLIICNNIRKCLLIRSTVKRPKSYNKVTTTFVLIITIKGALKRY